MPRESIAPVATEEEEHDVQEVRCAVTGAPIPAIPLWYANVRVRFVADAARSRSGGVTRLAEIAEEAEEEEEDAEAAEADAEGGESELSLEDTEAELTAEDIDLDIDDTLDPDEEAEEDAGE